jgi:hypothetical protein
LGLVTASISAIACQSTFLALPLSPSCNEFVSSCSCDVLAVHVPVVISAVAFQSAFSPYSDCFWRPFLYVQVGIFSNEQSRDKVRGTERATE